MNKGSGGGASLTDERLRDINISRVFFAARLICHRLSSVTNKAEASAVTMGGKGGLGPSRVL